jgi:hypothetical protein
MPRGDGTGPMGMGPMTGRAAGYCVEYATPGFMNTLPGRGMGGGRGWGRGFGRGRGMGWGRGWMYPGVGYPVPYAAPPAAPQDEPAALKEQAKYLTESLDDINRRLAELEKGKK